MRWLYSFDLVNDLDDIGIGSVYQCDTLTEYIKLSLSLLLERFARKDTNSCWDNDNPMAEKEWDKWNYQ